MKLIKLFGMNKKIKNGTFYSPIFYFFMSSLSFSNKSITEIINWTFSFDSLLAFSDYSNSKFKSLLFIKSLNITLGDIPKRLI